MSSRTRAPSYRISGWTALLILGCVGLVLMLVAYGAWWLATCFTGQDLPGNPLIAFGFSKWRGTWSPLATMFTVIAETALAAATFKAARYWYGRPELDKRDGKLATPQELVEVTGRSAVKKAQRLRPGVDLTQPGAIGLDLGTLVPGGTRATQSWEDVAVIIAGPRTGKTAGLAIGSVLDAPGPVIATSNKRDLRDHTRGVHESRGRRVWESDLQGITGGPHQDWYWNVFGGLDSLKAARRLAGRFVAAEKAEDARVDAYFDGGAQELLALYFLAAAVGGGDIMHSYGWLSDPDNPLPARLLEKSNPIAATKVRTAQALNPRQRDGIYDMALRNLGVLTDPDYARTVLPPQRHLFPGDDTDLGRWQPVHNLPEFDPAGFVTSSDVLYVLSMEGPDSASALTAALVGRLIDEALTVARRSPANRLPTPMVAVLDEAANVCKLVELPHWYSHLGSQGIATQTYLQSPAQGAKAWGPEGLAQLISAANVHYYGGGVKDTQYLSEIAQTIGDYDVPRWAASIYNGQLSHGQSWNAEQLMPLWLLAKLPKDRAVVMTTGNPPVMVKKSFWNRRPDADAIRASLEAYGPSEKELIKELA